jgi:hypothetical protein
MLSSRRKMARLRKGFKEVPAGTLGQVGILYVAEGRGSYWAEVVEYETDYLLVTSVKQIPDVLAKQLRGDEDATCYKTREKFKTRQ